MFQGSEAAAAAGPQSATAAAVGAAAAAAVATASSGQPAGAQGLLLLVPLMLGPNGKVSSERFMGSHGLGQSHFCLHLHSVKYIYICYEVSSAALGSFQKKVP